MWCRLILTYVFHACGQSDFYIILGCSCLFMECQFSRQSDTVSRKTSNDRKALVQVLPSLYVNYQGSSIHCWTPLSSTNSFDGSLVAGKCDILCNQILQARKEMSISVTQFLYQPCVCCVMQEALLLNQAVLDETPSLMAHIRLLQMISLVQMSLL